jgi:hypothetical protein
MENQDKNVKALETRKPENRSVLNSNGNIFEARSVWLIVDVPRVGNF